MVSNDEMVLIKVVRFEKTSIKIVSAKSQLSKIAENGPKMVQEVTSKDPFRVNARDLKKDKFL